MATYNPRLPSQVLAYFGLPSLPDGSNSIRYDSTTISILRQIDRSRNRQITSFSNIHPDGRTNYTSPSNNLHWAWNATTSTWTIVGANTGSWIASLVSSDLPPLSPSSTATPTITPTIGLTTTPTATIDINNISATPTLTSTPTPSSFIKCDPPTIYPNNTTFVGQKKYQIIFKTTRSNCDTNCSDKMVVNIKLKNLSKNIDNYYSFTVPDDAQSCCTSCDDNTNFQIIDEFYTTFIFDDLIVGDKYHLEATVDSILPTPTVTPTLTPTLTPTVSISPTLTPTITITPTITNTSSVTPTITVTPSSTPAPLEISYSLSLAAGQSNICYNSPCTRRYTISAFLVRTNNQIISPQPQLYFEFQQELSFNEWPQSIGGFAAPNNTASQAFSFQLFTKRIRVIITSPENGLSVTTDPIAPNIVMV